MVVCIYQIIPAATVLLQQYSVFIYNEEYMYIYIYIYVSDVVNLLVKRRSHNMHACMHACMHARMHAYMQTYYGRYITADRLRQIHYARNVAYNNKKRHISNSQRQKLSACYDPSPQGLPWIYKNATQIKK